MLWQTLNDDNGHGGSWRDFVGMYVIIQPAQKEGPMRCQSRFTVSVVSAFSRVSNDVHLRAKLPEHCLPLLLECRPHQERETKKMPEEKEKSTDGSAEDQIKANDLIVRRSFESR